MSDASDLGIVLYLRGPAAGGATSYVDRKGIVRAAGTLTTSYSAMPDAIDTAHPYVSAAAAASMYIIVGGSFGMGESVVVRCRQAYRPDPNPGPAAEPQFAGPPLVYFNTIWILQETSGLEDIAFTFTGPGAYLLQTASTLLGDELEFSAYTSMESSAATVMIAAKVGA